MSVKRYAAHTNIDDFKSDWHESKDGPMVRHEDYSSLEAKCAALAAELEAAEKRITELEARTVTLPDVEKWRSVDAVRAQSAYKVLVSKVLAAAGIGVKGE